MLTLKSPFNDFIQLCAKAGACDTADAKAPLSTMSHADTGVGMPPSGTCAEGLKIYLEDKQAQELALAAFAVGAGRKRWTTQNLSNS